MNYLYEDITGAIHRDKPKYVLHGCNCMTNMGAGMARTLAEGWKEIVKVDLSYMKYDNNVNKLGNYSKAKINGHTTVINMYTQYNPGPNFDIAAFRVAFRKIIATIDPNKDTILMPRIGCGIATPAGYTRKEMWEQVYDTIMNVLFSMRIKNSDFITIIGLPGDSEIYETNQQILDL